MSNVKLLKRDGSLVDYHEPKLGRYFSINEWRFRQDIMLYGELVVSDLLMQVADEFRQVIDEPLTVTSFNRSQEKQEALNKNPLYKAAKFSPHVVKLAMDVVPESIGNLHESWENSGKMSYLVRNPIKYYMRKYYREKLEQVSKNLDIKIRIGIEEYLNNQQSFIHFDVCPEYYAEGKPWNHLPHPEPWEREARW